jgi:hypothetical protein
MTPDLRGKLNADPKQKEEKIMENHANRCIECTVQQCAHHCESENYCSLDRILVGTHEMNPTMDSCTDCKSFRKK